MGFIYTSSRSVKNQLIFGLALGTVIAILALFVIGPFVHQLVPLKSGKEVGFSQYLSDLTYLPF